MLIAVPCLLLGGCFGGVIGNAAGRSAGTTTTAVRPAPTVTETVTENEEADPIEVTPEECLAALMSADKVIDLYQQAIGIVQDMFESVSEFDVEALDRGTKKIEKLTPKVGRALTQYEGDKSDCQDA